MFPTFTGTSRRPRNVNLSGQKHINPFAAHALSPSSGIGASRTVAEAQAGRRQRQQEREELKAARVIQRTWRGHRARRSVKDVRRGLLADLYGTASSAGSPEQRIRDAFPLLLSAYDVRRDDSRRLLCCFAEDLVQTDYGPLVSGQLPPTRLWHLVQILVSALDQ
ncbi:IQ motif, EF-hand binding site [Niveomyces insectorum RCEF 264]|uniref:IQ motif, EF-hand binding site n=1 Tax=Niveomyces insectorum RCEF 264 TaxID=1081102 RepID=A0A168A4V8_9HYPO|nr:IQ motif, EF-hand binding site [Niveomyces insectorum RCEF 264]